jgi:hypothetical protein
MYMKALSQRLTDWGMKLSTHIHIVSRLRMSELHLYSPVHAFMAWTGTTLPLSFYRYLFLLSFCFYRVAACPDCKMPAFNLAKIFGLASVGHSRTDLESVTAWNVTKVQATLWVALGQILA